MCIYMLCKQTYYAHVNVHAMTNPEITMKTVIENHEFDNANEYTSISTITHTLLCVYIYINTLNWGYE